MSRLILTMIPPNNTAQVADASAAAPNSRPPALRSNEARIIDMARMIEPMEASVKYSCSVKRKTLMSNTPAAARVTTIYETDQGCKII